MPPAPDAPSDVAPARRAVDIRIDEFGRVQLPAEFFRHIADLFPARFQQPVELEKDIRGQLAVNRLIDLPEGGTQKLWVRNLAEIRARLLEHGIGVTWVYPACESCAAPVPSEFRHRTLRTLAEHDILTQCRFGQIEIDSANATAEIIAEFCRAFPNAQFVVPVATNDEAKALQSELQRLLNSNVGVMKGLKPDLTARIRVATPRAARSPDAVAGCVVLIPFGRDTLPHWMRRLHCAGCPGRVYLLRTRDRRHADVERELELRYGPVLTLVERAVHQFSMVNFGGGARAGLPPCPAPGKRGRFWRHDARNRLISSLAIEMQARHSAGSVAGTVGVVLVENLEHGRQLQRGLPGWPLVGAGGDFSDRYVVATISAIEKRGPATQWVINAMGGPPSYTLEGWLEQLARRGDPVHLIDFTDGFGEETAGLSTRRAASYGAQRIVLTALPDGILGPARRRMRS